jgi:hypothetical protein
MTKTNYLAKYGVRKFQAGGSAPDPSQGGAPAPDPSQGGSQGGGQLEQMLTQVVQTQDPQMALQVCNALAQSMGIGGAQGGGAPSGASASNPDQQGDQQSSTPMGRYGMKVAPVFAKKR